LIQRTSDAGDPFPLIITDVHMPGMDGFELVEKVKQTAARDGAIVVMLTSGERPGDFERARNSGVSSYLVKPVRREELKNVIAKVLGRQSASPEIAGNIPAAPPSARSPISALASRILLAEDNLVNQLLVQRILEKRGHQVVVVGNGQEALAALKQQSFDLVLMDVQMPLMNGLEATRAIRESETLSATHTPIVALTAHAMKGDRERCLASGMDAYLSKPIQGAELLNIVQLYGRKESVELLPVLAR